MQANMQHGHYPVALTRVAGIDGLRALAVFAVMGFHYSAADLPGGFLGVDMFFVLSGFLITGLLITEAASTGHIDLAGFYARRGLRLYPALIVALLVSSLLAAVAPAGAAPGQAIGVLAAFTYTANIFLMTGHDLGLLGHTWSLAVEEQFYLLWPVLLAALLGMRRPRLRASTLILILFLLVITTVTLPVLGAQRSYFAPWTHLVELLLGALVAQAHTQGQLPQAVVHWGWLGLLPLALCLLTTKPTQPWLYMGGWAVVGVLSAVVVVHVVGSPQGTLVRLLSLRPVVWIGLRSYGVYLFSYPVATFLIEQRMRFLVGAPLSLVTSLLLAALSFALVERPALTCKRSRRQQLLPGAIVAASCKAHLQTSEHFIECKRRAPARE